jgi:epoxide hydrolase
VSDRVERFRVDVPEAELEDLRARLRQTRWPEPEPVGVGDWSQGVPLAYLQDLCAYWADGYDWRATEARLNALPQFRTEIDGLGIHYLHVRSARAEALPLVLTHGWPGSIVEYLGVVGSLSETFHVVCPSLPGYGFSDKPAQPGWGVERIAAGWAELMARLGYDRYGASGSDWGTSVSTVLGQQDAEHVVGIHLVPPLAPPDPATLDDLTRPSGRRSPPSSRRRSGTRATRRSTRRARRRSATG